MEKEKNHYLNSKEAAAYINVSTKTLYRKRISGELKYYNFCGIRFLKKDLDEYANLYLEEAFKTKRKAVNA